MKARSWILCAVLGIPLSSNGQTANTGEYNGKFLDEIIGRFIFKEESRPLYELHNTFRFQDPNGMLWTVPEMTIVDGASIPPQLWSVIGGPFEGNYLKSSVVHDYYCESRSRTAHDTHRAFYYGMKAAGVPEWKAKLMYWAVVTFGPKWELKEQQVVRTICDQTSPDKACRKETVTEIISIESASIDWQDEEVKNAAISKTESIARTLFTSNGLIVDSAQDGIVIATLSDIDGNANDYRQLLASRGFIRNPDKLGVLSQMQQFSSSMPEKWEGGKIPAFSVTIPLHKQNFEKITHGNAFRLDLLGNNPDKPAIQTGTNYN